MVGSSNRLIGFYESLDDLIEPFRIIQKNGVSNIVHDLYAAGRQFPLQSGGDRVRTGTGTVELDDGHRQGYGWNDLAKIASATEQKSIKPIFLPKSVAMAVGVGVEAIAKLRGTLPFVSPDKIQQLYFSDWVARGEGWPLKEPVGFAQGFKSTLDWYRKAQWLPERVGARKIVR